MTTRYESTTYFGRNEAFALQVSRGQIPGHSTVIVFGYNDDLDTTEESVWPDGGVIPHVFVASVMKVASSSANDTSAGTGARTVYIEGVDGDFAVKSEVVTLNGQTEVNTTHEYLAINQMTVMTVGSTGHNEGNINIGTGTVTAGVPAVLFDLIGVSNNQRTTGHYTVPAGYTGYLMQGQFSAGQKSGSTSVTGKLKITTPDNITRVGAISTLNNGTADYMFDLPFPIYEKTCVGATAIGSSANNSVASMFIICLIKNSTGY